MTPEIALINAIRTRLKNDAAVVAFVGQNVFDQIPEATKPPYIYIGPAGRSHIVQDCYQIWVQRLRIYVIYTSWNRTEVWEASEAVVQSLYEIELDLADPFAAEEPLNVIQAGDNVDPNAPKSVFIDVQTTITRALSPAT